MCSLFGFLDYQGIIPHKVLRKLTQALANAAEERGTDAAGISYINNGTATSIESIVLTLNCCLNTVTPVTRSRICSQTTICSTKHSGMYSICWERISMRVATEVLFKSQKVYF